MKPIVSALTWICIWCVVAAPTRAAEPQWTKLDGLPSEEVQFIVQDHLGTVWIGTLSGLVHYAYKLGQMAPTPVTASAWDVLRVDEQMYWVGTDGGVVRVVGDQVTPMLQGMSVGALMTFGDSEQGTLLALSKNAKTDVSRLLKFGNGQWAPVTALADMHVDELFKLSDGSVWACVEGNGVYAFDPNKGLAEPVHHHEGQTVTVVGEDGRGHPWVGLWYRGLAAFDGSEWHRHLRDQQMYVVSMRCAPNGDLYFATDQAGLWRYDGKTWHHLLEEEGAVNMLEITADGRVWVSAQQTGGLRYFDGATWHTAMPGPLPIRCLTQLDDGTLLAGGVLDGVHVLKP